MKSVEEKADSRMVNVHSETKYAIATSDYRCLECAGEVACEALYYSAVIFGDGVFQRRNYCVGCWKRNLTPRPGESDTRNRLDAFASWRTRRPAAPSERPKKVRFDPQLGLEFFLRLGQEPPGALEVDDESDDLDSRAIQQTAPDDGASDEGRTDDGELAAETELTERDGADPDSADPDARADGSSRARAFPGNDERDQLRFFLSLLLVRKKALKFKSSIDRGGQEFLLLVDRETPPHVHEVLNPGLSEGQLERLKDRLGELLQMQI